MSKKVKNKNTGNLGEEIAAKFVKNKGFLIAVRNYKKNFGEIDIVARRTSSWTNGVNFSRETSSVVHFIEVKSVSYETRQLLDWAVSHETYRPEELVHSFKLNQIRKAAETWTLENHWEGEVQVDVITVRIVPREKYALVKYIPGVTRE